MEGKIYGYVRVSTKEQNLERQLVAMREFGVPEKQIWLCSVIGAMLHNIGQITAAIVIMRSFGVLAYLPLLLVTGSLAGAFTGLCTQLLLNRIKR